MINKLDIQKNLVPELRNRPLEAVAIAGVETILLQVAEGSLGCSEAIEKIYFLLEEHISGRSTLRLEERLLH